MKIILASASPRRKDLLESVGLQFEIVTSKYTEEENPGLSPREYVKYLSIKKGEGVAEGHKDSIVISADTIVVLDNVIIGKPKDKTHASKILSLLSGNIHSVFTGYSIFKNDEIITDVVETKVHFHQMTKEEIEEYIETGEPMDKAGAYAIQGLGKKYIKKIEGCYHNVVGLPLPSLMTSLNTFR